MEVIRVKNPATFLIPEVQDLVTKMADKTLRVRPEDSGQIAPDILKIVMDDNGFIFLGEENGHFKLIIIGFLPTLALFPHPTIISFFNAGSRELRDMGKRKLMDFIQEAGYNAAWAANGTPHSDEAWKRVFGQGAVEINRVGTLFEFKAL